MRRQEKTQIPLKCSSGLVWLIRTQHMARDWQPLLPAKNHTALNQAAITAFSLSACRHCFCSNSAQSALSAAQGHTQKHKQISNTSSTHRHTYAGEIPVWCMSHPWQLQQVAQIKDQLCINCLGDHAAANVMTGAEVKTFRWKRCSLRPPPHRWRL